jgi:hypothetical protein
VRQRRSKRKMKKNNATLRKSRTSVTLVRMRKAGGVDAQKRSKAAKQDSKNFGTSMRGELAATGPVDE